MKRTLLLTVLLLAFAVPAACAGGANISWGNTCWGDVGSTDLLTWACNSNTYTGIRMTCSFHVDAAHTDFSGAGVHLSGWTEATTLPDWWQMSNQDPADCRWNAVSTQADYSVLPQPEDGGVCRFAFGGNVPAGGMLYAWDTNRMSVIAVWATADENALEAGQEYFLCQFLISAMKTVNGCTGCSASVAWHLLMIEVGYAGETEYVNADPDPYGGGGYLFWQAELPTAARNATWGQIKSLYR
jgi:hypothetical protein